MIIEQPPYFYRMLYRKALWRIPQKHGKAVFLTFDDGPIPGVTPWVLKILNEYGIKATFFCVGDNVRKHPEIYRQILENGHQTGNHTFNHLQGWKHSAKQFLKNTLLAKELIHSNLFRPPHGHMRYPQPVWLKNAGFQIVMWDVVTRDYSKFKSPKQVLQNVKRYTRNRSILVFHDSIKAEKNLRCALPRAIEWLKKQGYEFKLIPQ